MNDKAERYISGNKTARELISLFNETKTEGEKPPLKNLAFGRITRNKGKVRSKALEK